MPFNKNIFELAQQNTYFRQVLYTTERSQVVLMSIPPNEDIGEETHHLDQILVFVEGEAKAVLDDKPEQIRANHLVVEHKQGIIDKTKAEAEQRERKEQK